MAQKAPSTRRDPRLALPRGAGFVEFDTEGSARGPFRADLAEASIAGLTLELDEGPLFENGAVFSDAKVHIGECVIEGELLVKHSEPIRKSRLEVGCLFYPSSQLDEEKLSAVLEGLQAARGA